MLVEDGGVVRLTSGLDPVDLPGMEGFPFMSLLDEPSVLCEVFWSLLGVVDMVISFCGVNATSLVLKSLPI